MPSRPLATRRTAWLSFLGLALAARLASLAPAAPRAEPPAVIAHRGACGYLPEHTLVAKAMAHGMRPDYIEQDVVLSRDGVPVVLHDHYLDTVTDVAAVFPGRARADGRFYAIDFTLPEIRRLTVHERTELATGAPVFPGRFPSDVRIPLLKVPTLEEEILLIQGMNRSTGRDVGLYVELKAPAFHLTEGRDLEAAVLEVLTRHGYRRRQDRIFLQSFDPACLERLRRRSPLRRVQLIGDPAWGDEHQEVYRRMLSPEGLRRIASYADGIGPPISRLVEFPEGSRQPRPTGLLARAHELGMVVHPYTLRADALPGPMRSMGRASALLFHRLGVDGVFTDFPDRVVDFLERSGLRPRR